MGKNKKNLLIIGPLPEPKGGVSIHITRLSRLMQDDFNIGFIDESPIHKPETFNLHSKNVFTYLRLFAWADIVHIHSGIPLLRFIHILAATLFFRKTVVTIHSFSQNGKHLLKATALILKLTDKVVVVSKEISAALNLDNFCIKPAFIPPNLEKEHDLPLSITEWVDSRKANGDTVLAGNAFRIAFLNGNDLYGIDLCIDMLDMLVNKLNRKVSLIFVLASLSYSEEKFKEYKKLIVEYGLNTHMMLVHVDLSFVKLIEYTDLVLRPTCTDGDALTVREALFLGKPVIASDIVSRPEGTILFKNRDYQSMAAKVIEVLDTPRSTAPPVETLTNYKEYYRNLYLG